MVVVACCITYAHSQQQPDVKKMFSLQNLGEYNQLIDCVSNIRYAFIHCNEEAQSKGEKVLKYVDEKSELGTLLKCCGVWIVRDCWLRAAATNCTAEQAEQLRNMPSKMMPGLGAMCEKYPPGSSSCYTPHLILGGIMFSILIVLILLFVVAFIFGRRWYAKHRDNKHKLAMDEQDGEADPAEKVKLTKSDKQSLNNNNRIDNNNVSFIDADKN